MATTYIGSTLKTGSDSLTEATDGGFVVVSQSIVITSPLTATNVDATEVLPAGSQVIDFIFEKIVANAGGTATTLNISAGSAAGGTQYVSATDIFSTVRSTGATPTVAQVAARGNIGTNTTVYIRLTPNGTLTTAAQVRATLLYAQKL